MVQPEVESERRQIAFRSLVHGQDAPAFRMHPARKMEASRDQRIVQPSVHEVL
jgi:hypothetical protein